MSYLGAGKKFMDVVTYSGNGSIQSIGGLDFSPDLVWVKSTNVAADHVLQDTVRGTGVYLMSSQSDLQNSASNYITSFNSNGFTVGSGNRVNNSSRQYVAWTFKAGGAPTSLNSSGVGQTPTPGSVKINGAGLTSALPGNQVIKRLSANTTYGFSIVEFNAVDNGTYPTGLQTTPNFIIYKNLDSVQDWRVYHSSLTSGNTLYLNQSLGEATSNNRVTAVSSTTFTVGNLTDNESHIAYCWSEVPGFSKFGQFTGLCTSSKTVTLGFRPKFLIIKRKGVASDGELYYGGWGMYQDPVTDMQLMAHCSGETGVRGNCSTGPSARDIQSFVTFNDDGFTVSSCWYEQNDTTDYIYAAWAESAPGDPSFESVLVDQLNVKDLSGSLNNANKANVGWQTGVKKFYDGAAYFDNTSSFIRPPDSSDFAFGTGDFTAECWIYTLAHKNYIAYLDTRESGQSTDLGWVLASNASGALYVYSNAFLLNGSLNLNQWTHVAYCRSGGTHTLYVDGRPVQSSTTARNYTDDKLTIGANSYAANENHNGYIQDVRIYKGIAKYTSSFSPPERSVQGTARRYPSGVYVVS